MSDEGVIKSDFLTRACAFIVDKRWLFIALFIAGCIASAVTSGWVSVENDITSYLPDNTETKQGLVAMDEFTTFGTARVMLCGVSTAEAEDFTEEISAIEGVKTAEFDSTQLHYRDDKALISITFDGENNDDISVSALSQVKELSAGKSAYIYSEVGDTLSQVIGDEMRGVLIMAVAIVLLVLIITCRSYGEVPVLLLTFGAAALLNMGTNYWYGKISFVSNSVTVVLQLALALDYSIILVNRFHEERMNFKARDAAVQALRKAIPEISASSLTTICGLAALTFMQFRIGADMGTVLMKSIAFSLLAVFLFMPGLLVIFSGLMDSSMHKDFVPNISFAGKFAWVSRYIVPPIFILLVAAAFYMSANSPLSYAYTPVGSKHQNESQIAQQNIEETFGEDVLTALVVPAGDYEKEQQLMDSISAMPQVQKAVGLASTEAMDGWRLGDSLTAEEFAALAGMDRISSQALFAYYAAENGQAQEAAADITAYKAPLVDIFLCAWDVSQQGLVELTQAQRELMDSLYSQLADAKAQLCGEHYDRMLIYLTLPAQGRETADFIAQVHSMAAELYGEDVYLTGTPVSARDLEESFSVDNLIITLLSCIFVVLVIFFTFKSVGLSVLLIAVIQGSIWINFSIPYITDSPLFFMSYLVVGAIQMGANIDYAIVISGRYQELKTRMSRKEAIISALNQAFPTILTSGTIMISAGLLIGYRTSNIAISSVGMCIGRGTIISVLIVLFVLPQILLLGDRLIDKTTLKFKFGLKVPERFRDDF